MTHDFITDLLRALWATVLSDLSSTGPYSTQNVNSVLVLASVWHLFGIHNEKCRFLGHWKYDYVCLTSQVLINRGANVDSVRMQGFPKGPVSDQKVKKLHLVMHNLDTVNPFQIKPNHLCAEQEAHLNASPSVNVFGLSTTQMPWRFH